MTNLPDDIARCNGYDLDECADCLRRTSPVLDRMRVRYLWPHKHTKESLCEYYIKPHFEDGG